MYSLPFIFLAMPIFGKEGEHSFTKRNVFTHVCVFPGTEVPPSHNAMLKADPSIDRPPPSIGRPPPSIGRCQGVNRLVLKVVLDPDSSYSFWSF